ncbi:MAG: CHAT domain-containing protein [Thiofilum sp.]|uniref:CHAT domain-containing protein n=1 Tax=Thiofilum sp. TaxID=2212733 RepID=UPI003BB0B639
MQFVIRATERVIVFELADHSAERTITPSLLEQWRGYGESYSRLRNSTQSNALLSLGEQLFQLLQSIDALAWQTWLQTVGSRRLVLKADTQPNEAQLLLLNLPWELLAYEQQFLAADHQLLEIVRSIGHSSLPAKAPHYKDLSLIFMAADPAAHSGLHYEQEERAIFQATRGFNNLHLMVDDTGNFANLSRRISTSEHCDMVHLSCHGKLDASGALKLQLENQRFGLEEVGISEFAAIASRLQCLFLSACHSAEGLDKPSLVMELVRLGIPNVMGWDGAVGDSDASRFAEYFYKALAEGHSVITACAFARQKLCQLQLSSQANPEHKGQYWHLGRTYISAQGGLPLLDRKKPAQPKRPSKSCYDLLDKVKKEVLVASKDSFVGRRWQTKQALMTFQAGKKAGVLLYGVGGTGKSSLAARIVDCLQPTYKPVVLYKSYLAVDVVLVLENALEGEVDFTDYLTVVQQTPRRLVFILRTILQEHLADKPIVLVVDDIEQHILEPLAANQLKAQVKPSAQPVLAAIIEAFDTAVTESRLLITSRYQFSLLDRMGDDWADRLESINVPDMSELEQEKHWQARVHNEGLGKVEFTAEAAAYLQRVFRASGGNAGLQEVLFKPLLHGEWESLEQALSQIETYRAGQADAVADKDLAKYLERIALGVYQQALSGSESVLLRALTLFDFAVPEELLIRAGAHLGVDDAGRALRRLDHFGLLNHWQGEGVEGHITCYGLARKVVEPLSREDRHYIATVCAPLLWEIWFADVLDKVRSPFDLSGNPLDDFNIQTYKNNFSAIDKKRASNLRRFCIDNADVEWATYNFNKEEFTNLLELSLSLSELEKIRISWAFIIGLSVFQLNELFRILLEERKKFRALDRIHFLDMWDALLKHFSPLPELLRAAYEVYLPYADVNDMQDLETLDLSNEEAQFQAKIKLAKTRLDQAKAYSNYADFLADQKGDYAKAEELYERALEADPKHANHLGNYALFLANQKGDYAKAEQMYERALEADPKHVNNLGNYAYFLEYQKGDYEKAKFMYERALEADHNDANIGGNYAKLLFILRQDEKALDYLNQAEAQDNLVPDLQLELAFYRYAHCSPYSLQPIKKLLQNGARSLGWNLNANITRAQQDHHPQAELVAAIAQVISGTQDLTTLNQYPAWTQEP